MTTKYVAGFAFDSAGSVVALIRKNRPDWQKGKLNGIGGHVEEGETPVAAMAREFREETGVEIGIQDWHRYAHYRGEGFELDFFLTFNDAVLNAQSPTDEKVEFVRVATLYHHSWEMVVNVPWLVYMALSLTRVDGRPNEAKFFTILEWKSEIDAGHIVGGRPNVEPVWVDDGQGFRAIS